MFDDSSFDNIESNSSSESFDFLPHDFDKDLPSYHDVVDGDADMAPPPSYADSYEDKLHPIFKIN